MLGLIAIVNLHRYSMSWLLNVFEVGARLLRNLFALRAVKRFAFDSFLHFKVVQCVLQNYSTSLFCSVHGLFRCKSLRGWSLLIMTFKIMKCFKYLASLCWFNSSQRCVTFNSIIMSTADVYLLPVDTRLMTKCVRQSLHFVDSSDTIQTPT